MANYYPKKMSTLKLALFLFSILLKIQPSWAPLLIKHYLYTPFYLVFLNYYDTVLTQVNCAFRFGP